MMFGLSAMVLILACVAGALPKVKPLVPYEREQTKGNVRVVLLKVERATIFCTDGIRDPQPGKSYPVPTVGVIYLVEALGNEPIKNWNNNESDENLIIGNQKVRNDSSMPENLIAGGGGGVYGSMTRYANGPVELPKGLNDRRVSVQEIHERAVPLKSNTMRVTLNVGFNDERQTFVFDNIPLN